MPIDSEFGESPGYDDVIDWWLEHYRGLEHLHVAPEIMYTITSILERSFKKLKNRKP